MAPVQANIHYRRAGAEVTYDITKTKTGIAAFYVSLKLLTNKAKAKTILQNVELSSLQAVVSYVWPVQV